MRRAVLGALAVLGADQLGHLGLRDLLAIVLERDGSTSAGSRASRPAT
jgi:hypothetical protein